MEKGAHEENKKIEVTSTISNADVEQQDAKSITIIQVKPYINNSIEHQEVHEEDATVKPRKPNFPNKKVAPNPTAEIQEKTFAPTTAKETQQECNNKKMTSSKSTNEEKANTKGQFDQEENRLATLKADDYSKKDIDDRSSSRTIKQNMTTPADVIMRKGKTSSCEEHQVKDQDKVVESVARTRNSPKPQRKCTNKSQQRTDKMPNIHQDEIEEGSKSLAEARSTENVNHLKHKDDNSSPSPEGAAKEKSSYHEEVNRSFIELLSYADSKTKTTKTDAVVRKGCSYEGGDKSFDELLRCIEESQIDGDDEESSEDENEDETTNLDFSIFLLKKDSSGEFLGFPSVQQVDTGLAQNTIEGDQVTDKKSRETESDFDITFSDDDDDWLLGD